MPCSVVYNMQGSDERKSFNSQLIGAAARREAFSFKAVDCHSSYVCIAQLVCLSVCLSVVLQLSTDSLPAPAAVQQCLLSSSSSSSSLFVSAAISTLFSTGALSVNSAS